MKAALPAYSEAMGGICLNMFLSRVMRCQEKEEEEEVGGDHVPGLGTRAGSTLLFSTTARFCDIKKRRNCSFLTSSLILLQQV